MAQSLSVRTLAIKNLQRSPFRTFSMASLVALCSAVLFGSFLLASSLRNGISGMKERIGADLMIVPNGYGQTFESVLLSGEPNYFYMDKGIETIVRGIDGVKEVTSQFYLTSLSESCCDFPVQIIGFDPESDFLIKPWIQKYNAGGDNLFAGSNVNVEKNSVSFFSKSHRVSARLAKSGSGMDNSVFANLDTVRKIYEDACEKGFAFISDGDVKEKTSAIFIRIDEKSNVDTVALRIRESIDGVQVIQQGKFIRTLKDKMDSFVFFLHTISVLFLLVTVVVLAIVFSLTFFERRREFSILRVLGADRRSLSSIVMHEALFLGTIGSACGVFISALIFLPFNFLISQKIAMPFCMPNAGTIILFAIISCVLLVAACFLSAIRTAIKISKLEVYSESK